MYVLCRINKNYPLLSPNTPSYLELCNVLVSFNSLTTEKQTTKFLSANFQKILNPSYTILRIQRLEGKQCRS